MAPLPALGGDPAGRKERKRRKQKQEKKCNGMKVWFDGGWKYRRTI
jgi:hypothetical protein